MENRGKWRSFRGELGDKGNLSRNKRVLFE